MYKNKIKIIFLPLTLLMAIALLVSCGGKKEKKQASNNESTSSESVNTALVVASPESKTLFESRCSSCHGLDGKAAGPIAKSFNPPPRDLTSAEWQDSVDDEYLGKIIQYGGTAVGKSPIMPGNPDLTNDPKMLKELIAYIRSLKN